MPYDLFKEIKVKCNVCNQILVSKSEKEWTVCNCGSSAVRGLKNLKAIKGDCTDLTILNFEKIPEHKGWDDKPEDYTKEGN